MFLLALFSCVYKYALLEGARGRANTEKCGCYSIILPMNDVFVYICVCVRRSLCREDYNFSTAEDLF